MQRFVVRLGYDWVLPIVKEVEIDAKNENDAVRLVLAQSRTDGAFWMDAIEMDGEAGPTEVISVVTDQEHETP